MTYKVSIDAGHGMNTAGKRTPKLTKDLVVNGNVVKKKGSIIHEFEFNIKVAKAKDGGTWCKCKAGYYTNKKYMEFVRYA